jgi:hypothetical protein
VLLTRSPLSPNPKNGFSFDLHVLGTPPAFILSQDQTLRKVSSSSHSGRLRFLTLTQCFLDLPATLQLLKCATTHKTDDLRRRRRQINLRGKKPYSALSVSFLVVTRSSPIGSEINLIEAYPHYNTGIFRCQVLRLKILCFTTATKLYYHTIRGLSSPQFLIFPIGQTLRVSTLRVYLLSRRPPRR